MTKRWMVGLIGLALCGWVGCSNDDQDDGDPSVVLPDPGGDQGGDDGASPATPADDDSTTGAQGDDGATPADDGSAGAGADDGTGDTGDADTPVGIDTGVVSLRGQCDIDSGFPGDEACLGVPDPEVGIQIHVGPNDYDDPDEINMFVMNPNNESSECFMDKLPNSEQFHYLQWELSGRPGTHHIINTLLSSDLPRGFGRCENFVNGESRVGGLPGASRPHMPLHPVAPENAKLGIPVEGGLQGQYDMHYFNFTEEPILREFWLNLYFVDPDEIEETPTGIAGLGGLGWNFRPIQPGTMQVYDYSCPIDSDGRITQLLGHTHAHGDRFTAHIRRASGERLKVFEAFDYLEPQIYNYNSIQQNPDFSPGQPGAYSGVLEVFAGDALEWECEVNNDSDVPLRYTNEVETGEMCNVWGQVVGPEIRCFLQ